MDDKFIPGGRSQRKAKEITNIHHYRFDLFNEVVDLQLTELDHRFSEITTELLRCMACLNPSCSFLAFDKKKLIELAGFYPGEFSELAIGLLDAELDTYIMDMKSANDFLNLNSISDLTQKMVEKKRDGVYLMVYMLLKLSLTLPVASVSVERAFSAMNIVRSRLRNRMGDSWLNDCLVGFIEKSISRRVDEEKVIKHYQNMKTRRETL